MIRTFSMRETMSGVECACRLIGEAVKAVASKGKFSESEPDSYFSLERISMQNMIAFAPVMGFAIPIAIGCNIAKERTLTGRDIVKGLLLGTALTAFFLMSGFYLRSASSERLCSHYYQKVFHFTNRSI